MRTITRRNTNIAAADRNFGMGELLAEWLRTVRPLCGACHGWNHLPRRSDRHHHVYSVFAWLALVDQKP
jgi:hypothetical protein